jgi:hypothetical protein
MVMRIHYRDHHCLTEIVGIIFTIYKEENSSQQTSVPKLTISFTRLALVTDTSLSLYDSMPDLID